MFLVKKIWMGVVLSIFLIQTVSASDYDGKYICNPQTLYLLHPEQGAMVFTSVDNEFQLISVGLTKNEFENLQQQLGDEFYQFVSETTTFELIVTDNFGEMNFKNEISTKNFRLFKVEASDITKKKEYQVGLWEGDDKDLTEGFGPKMLFRMNEIQKKLDTEYPYKIPFEDLHEMLNDTVFRFFEKGIGRDFKLEKYGDEGNQIMFRASNVSSLFDFYFDVSFFEAICELKS